MRIRRIFRSVFSPQRVGVRRRRGHRSTLNLSVPLGQSRHRINEPAASGVRIALRFAGGSTSPQRPGKVAFQFSMQVDVNRLVDCLATHTHRLVMRKVSPKPMTDLLRRPPLGQLRRDAVMKRPSGGKLRGPRTLSSLGRPSMGVVGQVSVPADSKFTADC